jgi:hypothetical protein
MSPVQVCRTYSERFILWRDSEKRSSCRDGSISSASAANTSVFCRLLNYAFSFDTVRPPLWLVVRVPGYRYRGPGFDSALPYFLKCSGSGKWFTQPREKN